jgi:thioredoxin-dependent peroxiredoxin
MLKKTLKKTGGKAAIRKTGRTIKRATSKTAIAKKALKKASKKASQSKTASKKAAVSKTAAHALSEGMQAPAFILPRDGGQSVSLANFAGQKLVIFFYPRANTPGCTREAMDFSRLATAFTANQTAVLGVSADSLPAQESFRDKHRLTIPLMSDEKHEMLKAYSAWGQKSMYGKTFTGVLRTTVLIGSDGKIAKIWRSVKVDGHADVVLAAASAL